MSDRSIRYAEVPLAARAQQGERVRRIGVLMNLGAADTEGQIRAFVKTLSELGWSDGRGVPRPSL
jgi:putative ABC transport system substrate-binding protein